MMESEQEAKPFIGFQYSVGSGLTSRNNHLHNGEYMFQDPDSLNQGLQSYFPWVALSGQIPFWLKNSLNFFNFSLPLSLCHFLSVTNHWRLQGYLNLS